MGLSSIQTSFVAGELSPSLFGRTDLAKFHFGCSTLRNFFINYQGGASTRAGTVYCGMCKQGAPNAGGTGTSNPPRFIPFQYNINQGFTLEFGDQYMRILSDGAYITEAATTITGATNANPMVITDNTHGYSNGDWVYLSGLPGQTEDTIYATNFSTNVLEIIANNQLSTIAVGHGPSGVCVNSDASRAYVTNATDNTVSVINLLTKTVIATITVGSSPQTCVITPNNNEVYVVNVSGANVSVISTATNTVTFTIPVGSAPKGIAVTPDGTKVYVVNGSSNSVSPITVATHSAGIAISLGVVLPQGICISPDGTKAYVSCLTGVAKVLNLTTNTVSATIAGIGTTFGGIAISPDGAKVYVANATSIVTIISTASNTVTGTIAVTKPLSTITFSASGLMAYAYGGITSQGFIISIATLTDTVTSITGFAGNGSTLQGIVSYSKRETVGSFASLNNQIFIVQNATTNTFTLTDLFGTAIDSSAYDVFTSGGTAARIYTVVAPYAAIDLPYLKFTQSANQMSLTCVNQTTLTEYPPYDLTRVTNNNWSFAQTVFGATVTAPTGVSAAATSSTTLSTWYSYVVTAVNSDGEESVASSPANVQNNDIAINAGSNTITWTPVAGAQSYNIYAATPVYNTGGTSPTPIGAVYGFLGSAIGTQFVDTNITADFTVTPPLHQDPFARGQLNYVTVTSAGHSYTQATASYSINTATGSGFVGVPIIVNGALSGFFVENNGKSYASTDSMVITGSGLATGAAVSLNIGFQSGTYPSVVSYFQQRRGYANTLQEPNTYFFSHPGTYTTMDFSIPTNDADAIIGTPWAQQINGIQWMMPMPNGLVVFTGSGSWLLNGGTNAALTPADQTATPQASIGASELVQPILINNDILYVQSKNSIIRDLTYNFFTNIYMGEDKTILANHLFFNHTILQWAWAEEPYKLIWCVRDDGLMLCLTWLKEQDIWAWSRHDTNGLFVSVCSITELPVDAVYVVVQRYVRGSWVYYAERMNNRLWETVEDNFCVDAGLSYPMPTPAATLTPAAADGTANISSTTIASGGSGYVAPTAQAIDSTGAGTGATFSVTISGGVITAVTPLTQGTEYTEGTTEIVITDTTGTGAVVYPVITNYVNFTASAAVFSTANIGDVIRVGGGKATIVTVNSTTSVVANITQPITNILQNDPDDTPVRATSGNWTMTTPTTTVNGLGHLEDKTVAILADGSVVANQTVVDGAITLSEAASAIAVGLPFTAQLQSMYLDIPGGPTVQGKRKIMNNVVVRAQNTRGISVGCNQKDASTQPDGANVPWINMTELKPRGPLPAPGKAIPLFTGDFDPQPLFSSWEKPGQIAIEQTYPLEANILAIIPDYTIGETSG